LDKRLEHFLKQLEKPAVGNLAVARCADCSQLRFCPYELRPGMTLPAMPVSCDVCGGAALSND
jgi:hypothetical protein